MASRSIESTASTTDSIGSGSISGTVSTIACANCNRSNKFTSRFCSGCGGSLWDRCPKCGVESASGEAFCGGCGINLADFIQANRDDIEWAISKAKQLETQVAVSEAIQVLKAIKPLDDPRVKDLAERVLSEIERLRQKDDQQQQVLSAGIDKVRDLIKSHECEEALRILRKLPRELHNKESQGLLRIAEERVAEIARLKVSLVEAVKRNELLELAPQFSRLLTLRPNSKSVVQLASQVGGKIARQAQKRLQEFEYEKAADLLARVPECAIDEPIEKLRRTTAELRWLYDSLRLAPIVDEPLARIAARAMKVMPGDQKVTALCHKVTRLFQQKSNDLRFPATEYIRQPKRSRFDCQVKWLGGSKRVVVDSGCQKVWESNSGRFFAAVGLALQGVGLAAIDANLLSEKSGLMSKLTLRRRDKQRIAWGLDLGGTALKAVRLVRGEGESEVTIDQCVYIPHRTPLTRSSAELRRSELLIETLRTFLNEHPVQKQERVCVGQAGNRVLAKTLAVPDAPDKKLPALICYQAAQCTPLPLAEVAWAYHVFPRKEAESEKPTADVSDDAAMRRVLLLTEKLATFKTLTHMLDELKLEADIVQNEAVALYNFATYEGLDDLLSPEDAATGKTVALLDIGTSSSNLVCFSPNRLWIRSLVVGSDDFTLAAAKRLHLTAEQAEQLKREPWRAKSLSALYQTYEDPFDRLTSELKRSLDAFAQDTGNQVAILLGVGGGLHMHGLLRNLVYSHESLWNSRTTS